jgi:hypothetical protein
MFVICVYFVGWSSFMHPLSPDPAVLYRLCRYDFTKLLARLLAFVKEKSGALSSDPAKPSAYVISWLALAERLQMDVLHELILGRLRCMTKQQLKVACIAGNALRAEVQALGQRDTLCQLLALSLLSEEQSLLKKGPK